MHVCINPGIAIYCNNFIKLISRFKARFWEVVEKLKINHFYTTPSVIQKLMSLDKDIPSSLDLSSLRIIASGNTYETNMWLIIQIDDIQLVNV